MQSAAGLGVAHQVAPDSSCAGIRTLRMTEVACENVIQLLVFGRQARMFYVYNLRFELWD